MNFLRHRFIITGQVQGVGFRPFVYRVALENRITGSVNNSSEGVIIEAQGSVEQVEQFGNDLAEQIPPLARIVTFDMESIPIVEDEEGFIILKSTGGQGHSVLISADVATCPDCMADMNDPANRRHRYPFTNCTNCGPRYTITRSIPYDRPHTSMACFPLCKECQAEYDDPLDRRLRALRVGFGVGGEADVDDDDGDEDAAYLASDGFLDEEHEELADESDTVALV